MLGLGAREEGEEELRLLRSRMSFFLGEGNIALHILLWLAPRLTEVGRSKARNTSEERGEACKRESNPDAMFRVLSSQVRTDTYC